MDYLKIGKATDLTGREYKLYRFLEILPGSISWLTLLVLIVLSYFKPTWIAFFIIAFDVYWLLLVLYLGIHLVVSYQRVKQAIDENWEEKCKKLGNVSIEDKTVSWNDLVHLVIFPTYNEDLSLIRSSLESLTNDNYPKEKMIVVLAVEERGGERALQNSLAIEKEFSNKFKKFIRVIHPDGIEGELKGKGANQAWAAKQVKQDYIDKERIDYNSIIVSVFDIDTVIFPGYFYCLTYKFLTSESPYNASYQPVPVYHNNIWQAPFFARVAASSNTFWQMMQQIRQEKLATYSSHSMTWRSLVDIGFWSTKMVSEDSRIFWHCFCYYKGNYRVVPMYFPVSMDVCMDETFKQTAFNLYKQQRRWGWGVENLPYLMFNTIKNWKNYPKTKMINRIFVQLYGFHSWATNALIIAVVGWMPLFLGGDQFNSSTLSANLPVVSRWLMTLAMSGLVLSSIISTMLLPKKPKEYGLIKTILIPLQWIILPISIIVFGAIPGLEAQTRLMFGKYMGFWVTPKSR